MSASSAVVMKDSKQLRRVGVEHTMYFRRWGIQVGYTEPAVFQEYFCVMLERTQGGR